MTESKFVGPPSQPDRYQLTEVRGRGGEGELWVGWVTVGEQQIPVAVKIVRPAGGVSSEALAQRLQGEAELLRSLNHPGIVGMRETFVGAEPHAFGVVDTSSDAFYIVMNWVSGVNLEGWVAANPTRDPIEITRIVSRLSAAVDDIHSGRGTGGTPVLHRDIKPANVMVDGDAVTLVDFGLARLAMGHAPTIVGSAAYMAPETLAGTPAGAPSDRYGVGAVSYFLFCGVPPDFNNPAAMRANLMGVGGIADPEGLTEHVMSMLDPDPAKRPTNLTEWSQGLAIGAISQRFVSPGTANPTSAVPAAQPSNQIDESEAFASVQNVSQGSSSKRSKGPLIAVGVVLLAALIGGAVFFLTRDTDDPVAVADSDGETSTSTSSSSTSSSTSTSTTTSSTSTTTSTTTTTEPVDDPGAIVSPSGPQYLADFQPVDGTYRNDTGIYSVSGESYSRSISFELDDYDDSAFLEYNLGRKYSKLMGTLGLSDDVPADTKLLVQIYGDGVELLKRELVLGDAVELDVDITDVLRLRFQASQIENGDRQDVVVGDARVEP